MDVQCFCGIHFGGGCFFARGFRGLKSAWIQRNHFHLPSFKKAKKKFDSERFDKPRDLTMIAFGQTWGEKEQLCCPLMIDPACWSGTGLCRVVRGHCMSTVSFVS